MARTLTDAPQSTKRLPGHDFTATVMKPLGATFVLIGMRVIRRAIPAILAAAAAFSQTPAPRPEFEVAAIKPTAPENPEQINVGVRIDGAMVIIHSFNLRDYLALAYQVKDFQISGPDWLTAVKFDMNAKVPDGAPRSQLPAMLQALLEDRFKLTLHRDKKEYPTYALVVAKGGAKLKESKPDSEAAAASAKEPGANNINVSATGGGRGGAIINLGRGAFISNGNGHVEGHKVTMPQLLDTVGRFLDRPLVDLTGLTGMYDVSLAYGVEDLRLMLKNVGQERPIPDGVLAPASISESLRDVGLVLELRKLPLDVIVIDHMEKTPVAN
jgi:uncharacterized protein (TIGR03435 family)